MNLEELERRILDIRKKPLMVVCRNSRGRDVTMTVRECVETDSVFLHIAADELDILLSDELGE